MSDPARDTIFALSSGRPPAAIAVVRISGPRAAAALTALGIRISEARKAGLARVRDPQSGEIIDEALALFFPGPNSETGEDTAEVQLHGGRAVIAATLEALGRVEGLRPAEAGEFTRRAFENGKLDLTAVEGLADLVAAETEGQRRQAFRQMKGALGGRAEEWRRKLIQGLALVEARIDFSDEDDVPEDLVAPALANVRELVGEIEAALAADRRGERLREGLVVAIAGPPNAGKSTLLNRIARREAAIVSPYAGTTRDVIEVHLDLEGWPVTVLDTAGMRETGDPVELQGVRRARTRAAAADLVLWVVDAGSSEVKSGESGAAPGLFTGLDAGQSAEAGPEPKVWVVRNKIDMVKGRTRWSESLVFTGRRNESTFKTAGRDELEVANKDCTTNMVNQRLRGLRCRNEHGFEKCEVEFEVSAVSGEGFEPLILALMHQAEAFLAGAESALITRERHRRVLQDTLAALRRALAPELAGREDLLAEELRLSAHALGRLTGRVDVEDILDVIFRDFCIGK